MRRKKEKHTFEELKLFCEKNNRLPSNSKINKEEVSLYQFLWRHKDEPEFMKLKEVYPFTTNKKKYTFEGLKLFCEKNNRLPSKFKEEKGLYEFLWKHKDEPEFMKLKEMYPFTIKKKYTFEELKLFCEKNNRLPRCKGGVKGERSLYNFLWKHKSESKFEDLYKKYCRSYLKPDKKIEETVKVENTIIPEPEQTKPNVDSYITRVTTLTNELLRKYGSEITIRTLTELLNNAKKYQQKGFQILYGELGVIKNS